MLKMKRINEVKESDPVNLFALNHNAPIPQPNPVITLTHAPENANNKSEQITSPKKKKKKDRLFPINDDPFKPAFRKSTRKKTAVTQLNFKNFDFKRNNDYCECCNGTGTFLCCDSCPRSFHFTCLDPPVDPDNLPADDWYCRVCKPLPLPKGFSTKGIFGNLLEVINRKNSSSFNIPNEIKNLFEGVGTNEFGEFIDTSVLKNPKQRTGPVQTDINHFKKVRDKDNNIILCYKCRKSVFAGPMVGCDYCPSYWHMDCVNPPMAVPPQSHRRWKCPAHADHVAPKIKKFKCQVKGINGTNGDTSNELEVDEERITMEFVTKVAENKKLARFNEIKNIMQQDIIAKLIEPRTNVQNQLNVINSLGNITKNKEVEEEPKSTVDSNSAVNNDLREKFKKLINEITSTQKEDNNEEIESIIPGVPKEALTKPYIKIARPVYRQLNAVRQLVEVVDKKKLLDFLVENANINTNNS